MGSPVLYLHTGRPNELSRFICLHLRSPWLTQTDREGPLGGPIGRPRGTLIDAARPLHAPLLLCVQNEVYIKLILKL